MYINGKSSFQKPNINDFSLNFSSALKFSLKRPLSRRRTKSPKRQAQCIAIAKRIVILGAVNCAAKRKNDGRRSNRTARLHTILCRYYFKSRRLAWILCKIKLNLTVAIVSLKINLQRRKNGTASFYFVDSRFNHVVLYGRNK